MSISGMSVRIWPKMFPGGLWWGDFCFLGGGGAERDDCERRERERLPVCVCVCEKVPVTFTPYSSDVYSTPYSTDTHSTMLTAASPGGSNSRGVIFLRGSLTGVT